jgi:hypothetical protein
LALYRGGSVTPGAQGAVFDVDSGTVVIARGCGQVGMSATRLGMRVCWPWVTTMTTGWGTLRVGGLSARRGATMTGSNGETADDPGWAPLKVALATFDLTVCPICSAVVPDLPAQRLRHEVFHAAIQRAVTP